MNSVFCIWNSQNKKKYHGLLLTTSTTVIASSVLEKFTKRVNNTFTQNNYFNY